MRSQRGRCADQAVRPNAIGDVEETPGEEPHELSENSNQRRGAGEGEGDQDEAPGEEPNELNENGDQRHGLGGNVEGDHGRERLEDPQRVVPETGIGGRMRSIGDPRLPTQAEVDDHNITHMPYRNWCPHCVRGRGKDLDHR